MSQGRVAVQPGDVLAGKYRVERVLGAGGMGFVVSAMHLHLNERVAIKLLLPELTESRELLARFMREAQSAVRIKSEHVARVSDVGTLENGAPYMVMEHLNGQDLAQVLATRGPLQVGEALEYLLQACEAIAEAHSLGIVHRDLKPSNLFLTQRADGSPLVKVLDFGISKTAAEVQAHATTEFKLTSTGAVMGSPQYMSPEQVRDSKSVDQRTDIWALAIILYELLTARTAFEATTLTGLLARIVADPPLPIRTTRPDVPQALEATILQCLEKAPERRPRDIAELARQLLPYAPPRARISVERVVSLASSAPAAVGFDATMPAGAPHAATMPMGVAPTMPHVAASVAPPVTAGSWGGTHRGAPNGGGSKIVLGAAVAAITVGSIGVAGWMWSQRHAVKTITTSAPPASADLVALPAPAASTSPVAPLVSAPSSPPAAASSIAQASPSAHAPKPPSGSTKKPPSSASTSGLGSAIDSRR